jgi:hypothetical protein
MAVSATDMSGVEKAYFGLLRHYVNALYREDWGALRVIFAADVVDSLLRIAERCVMMARELGGKLAVGRKDERILQVSPCPLVEGEKELETAHGVRLETTYYDFTTVVDEEGNPLLPPCGEEVRAVVWLKREGARWVICGYAPAEQ